MFCLHMFVPNVKSEQDESGPKDANREQRGESTLYLRSEGSDAIGKHLFTVVLVLMNSSVPKTCLLSNIVF